MNPAVVWEKIPFAPNYEISNFGVVRNIKTKRIIKPQTRKEVRHAQVVGLFVNGKQKFWHVKGLLYFVHGIISDKYTHARVPLPVVLSQGNRVHYFETCRKAAIFLAPLVGYSAGRIANLLAHRAKEIFGWKINYQR